MKKLIPITITNQLLDVIKEQRFLTGLALFYVFSVIWGAYRFYSPIPQLDMWGGYLDFYLQILNGNSDAWLGQHNEHRPILSRVLFYIDLAYLNGRSLLLIPVNVILMFVSWYIVLLYANKFLLDKSDSKTFYYILVLLTVFSLSWKQDENIIWAFQSQFWFAFLLPLLSFFFLAKSESHKEKEQVYFFVALLLGVLSAGSMANGIFALPVLMLMSLAFRKNTFYSFLLGVSTLLVITLYLYGYQTPAEHISFIENILNKPWQTMVFFIEYIGVPPKNIYASFIFGLMHLYLIVVVLKNTRRQLDNPFYISIVAYLLYYLITAVITSGGRVNHGFNAALMGRYTTPTLISVSLSLILYLYIKPQHFRYFGKRTVVIIAVLMLGTQIRTVIKNVDKIHDVRDRETMQMVLNTYVREAMKHGTDAYNYKKNQQIADRAYYKKLSIFGVEPFQGKREKLGGMIDETSCRKLNFSTSSLKHIDMLSLEESMPVSEAIYITNHYKQIIGYGLASRQYKKSISLLYGPDVNKGGGKISLYRCPSWSVL